MTPTVQPATQNAPEQKRLSLAEQLARSLDDDMLIFDDGDTERERADDDEGSFGG